MIDFTLPTSDGGALTGQDLIEMDRVALYFISEHCPVNARAVPFFWSLHAAYGGVVPFIGVVDADQVVYDRWNEGHGLSFPVVLDKRMEVIRGFGVGQSPTFVVLEKGKEVARWRSYGQGSLEEMSTTLARVGGVPPREMSWNEAPEFEKYG